MDAHDQRTLRVQQLVKEVLGEQQFRIMVLQAELEKLDDEMKKLKEDALLAKATRVDLPEGV